MREATLPTDSGERKEIPLARGCLDYFPAALAEVAKLSMEGNKKHNPGEDLHWARGKSMDHADCILRHLAERGTIDTDGLSHSVKVAWRALALLQEELEGKGAPMARGARFDVQRVSPPDILNENIKGPIEITINPVLVGLGGHLTTTTAKIVQGLMRCARCDNTELWHEYERPAKELAAEELERGIKPLCDGDKCTARTWVPR